MDNVRVLISTGKTAEAIQALEDYFKANGIMSELDKVFLLKAQYNRWKSEDLTGLAPKKEDLHKIESSLLSIVNSFSGNSKIENTQMDSLKHNRFKISNSMKYGILLLGIVFLTIGIVLYFRNTSNKNTPIDFNYTETDDEIAIIVSEEIGHRLNSEFEKSYIGHISSNDIDLITESNLIIKRLNGFSNDKITITSEIYKHFGIAMCHKIIALSTSDKAHQNENANKMLDESKKGLVLISKINDGSIKFKNEQIAADITDWLIKDKVEENLSVLVLIANCIKKVNGVSDFNATEMQSMLSKLSENEFLKKEGLDKYPILRLAILTH
jgi:hypothetical protein